MTTTDRPEPRPWPESKLKSCVWWVHVKTGHFYEIGRRVTIEATVSDAVEYRRILDKDDPSANEPGISTWWVRPVSEFLDGRFQPVPACIWQQP